MAVQRMIVFVTGATGFVGRAIVNEMARQGHVARCLVRHPEAASAQWLRSIGNAELIKGDLLQERDLAPSVAGCDGVIHLVGIIAEAGRNTFERVHVEATRRIVYAAVTAGVRRYIHMSAMGTRPNAPSAYHRTKWAAEEIVRSSGLDWTIFRPSLIHGPGDQFVNRFAQMSAWAPFMPVIGPGTYKLQPVSVQTVAHCFVAALSNPRAIGHVYDLCGDEQLTFVQVIDAILAAAGRRRPKLHLPVKLAMTMASAMEFVWPRLFNRAPPLARDQILMLQEDNVGDPRPARETFGLGPEDFTTAIKKYIQRTGNT